MWAPKYLNGVVKRKGICASVWDWEEERQGLRCPVVLELER